MNQHKQVLLAGLAALTLSSACSTVSVRVPIMRPAEINLRGKSEVVLGAFTGKEPTAVLNRVKSAIGDSEYLTLINSSQRDAIMDELRLSLDDLADPEKRKELGLRMTGSVMLVGRVDTNSYEESTWEKNETCKRKEGEREIQYRCVYHYRRGVANLAVGFDVLDIQTGENLRPKRLSCQRQREVKSVDHNPPRESSVASIVRAATGNEKASQAPPVNGHGMKEQCLAEVTGGLMKAIAPWRDYVRAPFEKHGDVPQLERGIAFAKLGEWDAAIEQFREGLEFAKSQPEMDADGLARAHWNLGLAYTYTWRFDEAEAEVKTAYGISDDEDYLKQLRQIKQLKSERERFLQQSGDTGAGS